MNEGKVSNPAGAAAEAQDSGKATKKHGSAKAKLALGALGVVYGDIGTSPLYALKECVTLPHGVAPSAENIFGLLSLVFWSITLVVSVKYILYVMRADNNGEGGVLALMALAARVGQAKTAVEDDKSKKPRRANWHEVKRTKYALILLGLFGSALLYGDGVITPAISVLSAVEGLEVATHAFTPVVAPLTCIILVALFWVQKRGTGGIGAVFGPVTLCWFIAIGATGLPWVIRHPEILAAANPIHGVRFFAT
ncbi:MAG TPA: KUP/HAK/KT family potassium transporter, partial [Polyangia bacterium]